jgi:hypothetical protein
MQEVLLSVVAHFYNLGIGESRQEDHEFKASLAT